MTATGTQTVAAPGYDSAGNLITDQSYGYVYDGQGHMCAAHTAQGMVGYIYDAEGNRVAKGTITAMTCDPTANGFVLTTLYELGPNGQPMTEVDNGAWSHTDVYAGGVQVATYDGNGVHFQLHDWLGTRRVQTNYGGRPDCGWPDHDGFIVMFGRGPRPFLGSPSPRAWTKYVHDRGTRLPGDL